MKKLHFSDMPLRKKITLITVVSTSLSLLIACAAFILVDRFCFMGALEKELSGLASRYEQRLSVTLQAGFSLSSLNQLQSLGDNPAIVRAFLFDADGMVRQQYHSERDDVSRTLPALRPEGVEFNQGGMGFFHSYFAGGKRIGTLYLEANLTEIRTDERLFILLTFLIWTASLMAAFFIAARLQKGVTVPLKQVVDRMEHIAKGDANLKSRLEVTGKDEIGKMAEAFNTFVGKLQDVEEMKLDIISVVSHQLKTPVAEINGFIENMLDGVTGELNPKQKRYLEEMRIIGWENYKLISDLLSASKIERGVVSVALEPVSTHEVVTLAIRDYEKYAGQKGLRMRLEGIEGAAMLYADREKMVEALRNLINNAIKCTDQGSVTIRATTEGDLGAIEVSDTGIGMDGETMGRLFTKARVLGREAGRSGAGLGLYISKSFMKLQNGDITVESEPGKGSRFKLLVPQFKGPVGAAL